MVDMAPPRSAVRCSACNGKVVEAGNRDWCELCASCAPAGKARTSMASADKRETPGVDCLGGKSEQSFHESRCVKEKGD